MPYFMIVLVPYINLLNLSCVIEEYGAFKRLCEFANNVEPDQTADLGLQGLHMPFCQKWWCTKF